MTPPRRVEDLPLPPAAVERIAMHLAIIHRLGGYGQIIIEVQPSGVRVTGGETTLYKWEKEKEPTPAR